MWLNFVIFLRSSGIKGVVMQSHVTHDARNALTEHMVAAKARLGLSYADLAEGTGLSVAYVTAAILGQHPLPENAARGVAEKLGLDPESAAMLQTIPLRGSIPGNVPTDPTIYRFYEMVQVYGTTLKALVHEEFGDGIISAINFRIGVQKVDDPEGGSRAVITLDGKFLPYKPF
jgi:cyanate lyase